MTFSGALVSGVLLLLLAELERTDLRRIIYGRLYGVAPATLESLLVVPRL